MNNYTDNNYYDRDNVMTAAASKDKRAAKRWKTVFIVLAVIFVLTALGLGLAWIATARAGNATAEEYRIAMEGMYQKSYYDLSYNVGNMSNSLNKLSVANTEYMQKELLSNISAYSASAATSLSSLAQDQLDSSKTMKYINQVGDYCKFLENKLNKGKTLSGEDRDNLKVLSKVMYQLRDALGEMQTDVQNNGYSFVKKLGKDDDIFTGMVEKWEKETISYPSMIYDGPFSDGLNSGEISALGGADITDEEGEIIARKLLNGREIKSIKISDGSKTYFDCIDYSVETELGTAYITLARQGGMPVSLKINDYAADLNYDSAASEKIAEDYLVTLGFDNMKAVWVSNYNNIMYINCAFHNDGLIFYPDLIKVQVNGETGDVIGLESLTYITNHTDRSAPGAGISAQTALDNVSMDLHVVSVRQAVVPSGGGSETLTYEVYGTKDSDKYFIYIDADSGYEIKIMRVIDSEQGMLLQ